ncbi:MAG: tRNA 2-thiouridine(34) synthase MnmA [Deltaproteobacteria bacterium RIFCSPHIGHO2_02_FULL_40_11]|nr:MAG: tRNA 2-thiouridine(34) synthase MnmA [Deltaproteobacteria bacterium RIFCSPHIGHO2_02_FULL_40_11]
METGKLKTRKKRVVVALSGGVDSSVAAALLKEEGHEVIGISMQLYDQSKLEDTRFDSCCSLKEVDVARRVAQILEIPYYVLNFEDVFQDKVVNYFVDEYLKGRTPNPCVRCNTDVKFHHLIRKARELNADYLATGHYVRNLYNETLGEYELLKAKDRQKDQSYFLFGTDPKELPFLLFPLGDLTKPEVRAIAQKYNLPNAHKAESMEICFIPSNNYKAFIQEHLEEKGENLDTGGEIISEDGSSIGKHEGYHHYTIGQRKGLGISNPAHPLYVLDVNQSSKTVTVGSEDKLYMDGLIVQNVNWLRQPSSPNIHLKIRHSQTEIEASLEQAGDSQTFKVYFHKPHKSVCPGQAAVFYEDETLLGGGWIDRGFHKK